jgi:hypothetical protein
MKVNILTFLISQDFLLVSLSTYNCFVFVQDVHGPILGYRAVKFIVIAVFVGFAFASIVSVRMFCMHSIMIIYIPQVSPNGLYSATYKPSIFLIENF